MGVLIILRLMNNSKFVRDYVISLPAPSPAFNSYISWFNILLKNGLDEKYIFASINKQ